MRKVTILIVLLLVLIFNGCATKASKVTINYERRKGDIYKIFDTLENKLKENPKKTHEIMISNPQDNYCDTSGIYLQNCNDADDAYRINFSVKAWISDYIQDRYKNVKEMTVREESYKSVYNFFDKKFFVGDGNVEIYVRYYYGGYFGNHIEYPFTQTKFKISFHGDSYNDNIHKNKSSEEVKKKLQREEEKANREYLKYQREEEEAKRKLESNFDWGGAILNASKEAVDDASKTMNNTNRRLNEISYGKEISKDFNDMSENEKNEYIKTHPILEEPNIDASNKNNKVTNNTDIDEISSDKTIEENSMSNNANNRQQTISKDADTSNNSNDVEDGLLYYEEKHYGEETEAQKKARIEGEKKFREERERVKREQEEMDRRNKKAKREMEEDIRRLGNSR